MANQGKSGNVSFTNRSGVELAARIELPADMKAVGFVLLAHCFTCSKDLSSHRRVGRMLTDAGLGVMSFDFTGLGRSGGDFSQTDFASQATDIIDAVAYLTEAHEAPRALIGHSLGGTACLYAAREVPDVLGVATIGSPAAPAHVEKLFVDGIEEIERSGEATVSIGGRPFCVRQEFLEDIRSHPPQEWIGELKADLLILHSPVDAVVGVENAEQIFKSTRHPKSFVSLRQADHLLSKVTDAQYAGRILGAWARALVPEPSVVDLKTNQQVAARIEREKYTVQIRAGRHTMIADEPESVGGQDLGGNPYDHLLASLGACTAMTLRTYADRKEIDLESATIHLSHEKFYATDCEECGSTGAETRIDRIERVVELEGNLSDEQRARMLEIADKCPVHRTLTSPTVIDTRLA